MPKKVKYSCIRCGYETDRKGSMKLHLYQAKKPCPSILNVVVLTDEIKQDIINNRVHHLPKPEPIINNTINQIVNHNNTVNNLIAGMDVVDKLNKFMNFNDKSLIDFSDTIENKFKKQAERLEIGTRDDWGLDKHNLLEVVDQVCSLTNDNFENFNILYDEKFNKLKLYECGTWNDSIIISGVRTLLITIQASYFVPYECYLIRKIEFSGMEGARKAKLTELLGEYYKFIGCFDIEPFVEGKNNSEIEFNRDDDKHDSYEPFTIDNTTLSEKYMKMYVKIRDETMKSQLNEIKRNVLDIVKKNSKKNVDELNKKVMSLFHMDEEFKKIILPQ